ncbi:hypothetical protein [Acidicapsa acidisoli]|uniref:hypothetical protein n=1 Tax=Acidicapsa acidisoli TaxID=1615681 RepID=UPI0021E01472|nr:hypothetical protein [Acidicapsa acidisoli]
MGKWYRAIAISALFAGVCFNHSIAQQNGPKGVLVNYCLNVSATNGTYRFTNKCAYLIQVAAGQPYPNGQPNGAETFGLQPNDSHTAGTTTEGTPHYWACASPSVPIIRGTNKSPQSNSNDVICSTGGIAGQAN